MKKDNQSKKSNLNTQYVRFCRKSIGDAEPDDPRLGGIGEEERKKFVIDLFQICFQKKTTWGLKAYYCITFFHPFNILTFNISECRQSRK